MKQLAAASAILCLTGFAATSAAQARDEITLIHQFDGSGYSPYGNVTLWHRQIFGTTSYGGINNCIIGCGTVYRLSPAAGGTKWKFETLYRFTGGADGGNPYAQLTIGPDGGVYGYTNDYTQGTIFRLVPPARQGGSWIFQTLYIFKNGADGNLSGVSSPLILRGSHLYGVASGGSQTCINTGCGSVFRLDPPAPGQTVWRLVTLYAFSGMDDRGAPNGLVGPDAAGAFYASTSFGKGAVVQLAPAHGHANHWHARIISSFPYSKYGYHIPYDLLLSASGTLYGLAFDHGGDFFSLTPPSGAGRWIRTEIARYYSHGYLPSSLAFGPGGSLIGVTYGDQDLYFGDAFQLSPPAGGSGPWTPTLLWNFDQGPDQNPNNIVAGENGELFGVLSGGGYGNGSIFELTP